MLPPAPFYKLIFWQPTRAKLLSRASVQDRASAPLWFREKNRPSHRQQGPKCSLPCWEGKAVSSPTPANKRPQVQTSRDRTAPFQTCLLWHVGCTGNRSPEHAAIQTCKLHRAPESKKKKRSQKKNKSRGTNFTGTVRGTKRVPCQKPALTCTKKQDTFWAQKHTPDMCTTSLLWKPVLSGEHKPNGKQEKPKHSTTSGEKQPLFAGKALTLPPFPSSEGIAFYFDEAQLSFKWTTAEGDHC